MAFHSSIDPTVNFASVLGGSLFASLLHTALHGVNARKMSTREGSRHRQKLPQTNNDDGLMVVFFAAHGGSGSTMLATHVGAHLASRGISTCLVDLDLQFGSVLTHLGMKAARPLSFFADFSNNAGGAMATATLPRHHSGLCVLSQVGALAELETLSPERVVKLFAWLRKNFAVVLVDGVRDFNDYALEAVDLADRVFMVATQDVPAIRGVQLRLKVFRQLDYDRNRIQLVINRYSRTHDVTLDAIQSSLQLTPAVCIDNDFRAVHRGINVGKTLFETAPQRPITQQLKALSDQLTSNTAPSKSDAKKRGIWQRLRGGQ